MGFFDLHAELLRLIFEEIWTPSTSFFVEEEDIKLGRFVLYALCLTSKVLNSEATRILYANMTGLRDELQYKFLGTLEKKPNLAALVRCYHTPRAYIPAEIKGRLMGRLRRSLQLMVNLKEFTVYSYSGGYPSKIYPTPSEDGKMPFQLATFKYAVSSPSVQYRDEVLGFLATQVELKYLAWGPNTPIAPEYLEKISHSLIRVEGTSAVINSILPGRSIKELRWRISDLFKGGGFKKPIDRTRTMSIFNMPEFRSLTRLFLPDGNTVYLLEHLAELKIGPFENLEVLLDHSIQESSATRVIRLLQLFPKLNTLVVPHSQDSNLDSSAHKEKLIEILNAHPNIQCAYEFGSIWACADQYRRWTRENDGTVKSQFCGLKTGYPLVRYIHYL